MERPIKQASSQDSETEPLVPYTLGQFLRYFLYLGTFGFGGTIVLAARMQQDLVIKKRWLSKQDYLQGLALAQLCPGPLSSQLAMYLGWLHGGNKAALLVALTFIFPSFCIIVIISAFYVHFGTLPWIQGVFYGVGACAIALIAKSAFRLARMTIDKDWLLVVIFVSNAIFTAVTHTENIGLLIISGIVALFIKAPPIFKTKSNLLAVMPWPLLLSTGLHEAASGSLLLKIFLYFMYAGAFVFGSGFAIIPFLQGSVVGEFHWLNERQFMDAIAVAMIVPGPTVITVAFIGYLTAGFFGASLAAIGVFIPCYLLVIILAPYYKRATSNRSIKAFVQGVTAAAIGALGGSLFILGKQALVDYKTVAICLITLIAPFLFKRIPDPILILAAGLTGFLIKGMAN